MLSLQCQFPFRVFIISHGPNFSGQTARDQLWSFSEVDLFIESHQLFQALPSCNWAISVYSAFFNCMPSCANYRAIYLIWDFLVFASNISSPIVGLHYCILFMGTFSQQFFEAVKNLGLEFSIH